MPRTIGRLHLVRARRALAVVAALAAPLVLLSFRPVEEIDSINYLHYLIEWMANRTTPYDFATNYVAFWELSFLPAWVVTRLDLFFPLLALKALVLLGLAAWLLGREFRLRGLLLAAVVAGSCLLRHLWYGAAGVSTLKNDTLSGVGFLLLALVTVRAARRRLRLADLALLAGGVVFAPVKYLGIFLVPVAAVAILWLRRDQVRAHFGAAVARRRSDPAFGAGHQLALLRAPRDRVRLAILPGADQSGSDPPAGPGRPFRYVDHVQPAESRAVAFVFSSGFRSLGGGPDVSAGSGRDAGVERGAVCARRVPLAAPPHASRSAGHGGVPDSLRLDALLSFRAGRRRKPRATSGSYAAT